MPRASAVTARPGGITTSTRARISSLRQPCLNEPAVRMKVRLAFIVAVALCLPVGLTGQSSTTAPPHTTPTDVPVFRTGVESVRFDAFVTDKRGKPVSGLTVDDFEVYEDNVAQVIQ